MSILRSLVTTDTVSSGSVWNLEQICRVIELGLGASSDEQIEIVMTDTASRAVADDVRQWITA